MSVLDFKKSFTQQEAITPEAIAEAVRVLQTGRLHRYNTIEGEDGDTALWEQDYAAYQGAAFCLATTSGGTAMQIALRAVGVQAGDAVLTNAFTLAPVPGAVAAVGATPIFVETTENLTIDLEDLSAKLLASSAKFLLLSHMRGHLTDMDALCTLLTRSGVVLIEDCAHTMGAEWNGTKSGNFGKVACFSTQTYKHLNSGEGGLLTTNDPDVMARSIILSGSYMLFEKHLVRPDKEAFETARFESPNCSSRLDNLRAAILRPQLANLDKNVERWNRRYKILENGLSNAANAVVPVRPDKEFYVGSSFQFLVPLCPDEACRSFVAACKKRGVELKWFGDANPVGFTSRYDSWTYAPEQSLPQTINVLRRVMDLRVPLSFTEGDCETIGTIIFEELAQIQA
ncbi:DegT/DnrJ/EryC1/StrS family aminotransferase [uncultured Roseibium sp.]|uniref:DegT/DnrJ/EryC1/StrS family aminotransferase n=1 Tax=uncultured Roseibium sp. TaxID=1936171 RepID=UPI0026139426|nr:DegT/DnrJ/EryC1/StrS family aminotransferase [uncultured Roseibium sp.]